MIVSFIVLGEPVGLGATLIVASLILGRAGPWWRREPAPPQLVAASARAG
jgi:arabinofuranan 3-O-arabinosyltransferase